MLSLSCRWLVKVVLLNGADSKNSPPENRRCAVGTTEPQRTRLQPQADPRRRMRLAISISRARLEPQAELPCRKRMGSFRWTVCDSNSDQCKRIRLRRTLRSANLHKSWMLIPGLVWTVQTAVEPNQFLCSGQAKLISHGRSCRVRYGFAVPLYRVREGENEKTLPSSRRGSLRLTRAEEPAEREAGGSIRQTCCLLHKLDPEGRDVMVVRGGH